MPSIPADSAELCQQVSCTFAPCKQIWKSPCLRTTFTTLRKRFTATKTRKPTRSHLIPWCQNLWSAKQFLMLSPVTKLKLSLVYNSHFNFSLKLSLPNIGAISAVSKISGPLLPPTNHVWEIFCVHATFNSTFYFLKSVSLSRSGRRSLLLLRSIEPWVHDF